ncbi:MAG TPA: carbohydrate porin [Cyanobacteria bacterium UBA11372]|nr:carbohydrate porin [Cyanobacteria bacterium UBA11372]
MVEGGLNKLLNLGQSLILGSYLSFIPSESSGALQMPFAQTKPGDKPFFPTKQNQQNNPRERITPVWQLTDVQPTDWAYQALRSLVERYGVIQGYPDGTFRGNRPLSRYEFAAALYAAMEYLRPVTKEEMEAIKRLQAEFSRELAEIKGKFESIENRLGSAEPFSLTTKLTGQVVFAVSGVGDTERADGSGERTENNITFGQRTRLNFDTSFTGKERLRTRIQASNISRLDRATGTNMARLSFQGDSGNEFELNRLSYRFTLGKKATILFEAVGGGLSDLAEPINPLFGSSSEGAISRFATRNPIYRQGGGSGVGMTYEFNDNVSLSLGYLAEAAKDPRIGISSGAYGAIAQLTFEPSKTAAIALTYVRSYNNINTGTGSDRANDPFDDESEAIAADSLGVQSSIEFAPNLTFAGWVGVTRATATDVPNNPQANILNWALTLAATDLIKEGSLAGLMIGVPPKVINNDFAVNGSDYEDADTSLQLEAFYRYPVMDNIAVTLGFLVVTNPEHNRDNDTIYLGTLRTTFSF